MAEPKIRFKNHHSDWERTVVDDVFELRNGYTPSKNVNQYWENGVIPWFRMEDIRANGGILSDSIQHITPQAVKGGGLFVPYSIILATTATIGVHAMIIADSLANQRFTNFSIRKSLIDKYDSYFIYYAFYNIDEWSLKNTNSGGLLSVDIKGLLKQPFLTPSKTEQQQIASYFKSLDVLIQSTTKKIASLKQLKSASLISMFPQAGETKPRVRFKGFEGDWENINLSEVFIERHEISTITESLPQLSFTIAEGVIKPEDRKSNKRDFLIKDIDTKKYLVTYRDDIIYNPANVIYGAIHKNSLCNGVVSPIYKIFYTDQNADFMECIVRKPSFIQEMTIFMEGTVKKLKTLKPESFLKMSAYISPSLEEQKKIGDFFHSLNIQITLETQRLDKLKQIKSACLDKMFV